MTKDEALLTLWKSYRHYGEPIPKREGYDSIYDVLVQDGTAILGSYQGESCFYLSELGGQMAAIMYPDVKLGT